MYMISIAGKQKERVMVWKIENSQLRTRMWANDKLRGSGYLYLIGGKASFNELDGCKILPDSKYIYLPEGYTLDMAITAAKLVS